MNKNNKFLDHGYCSTESKNFIRANDGNVNADGPGKDILALLKENKQLKAMLIRHLDLIQEQNDQIIFKDKEIAKEQEEKMALRERNSSLEVQVLELQKQVQQKRFNNELKTILSPPPLAKIQCKNETLKNSNLNIPKTRNLLNAESGKFVSKIILHRIPVPVKNENLHSPKSTTTEEFDEVVEEEEQENISHIKAENSNERISTSPENIKRTRQRPRRLTVATPIKVLHSGAKARRQTTVIRPISGKPSILPPNTTETAVKICVTPPTPSRGKQMPLMIWHANELPSDESISCDSIMDADKSSSHSPASLGGREIELKPPLPIGTAKDCKRRRQSQRLKERQRDSYLSTTEVYCTRDWEDEEFIYEHEFTIEDSNALLEDAPMLEIPKWTEHDIEITYSKENTEDLSDDTFLRRHAKLELDERRRKKWDVQQIREQRRIERLKRRHCKDELQLLEDQEGFYSFYPSAETVQVIQFMKTLPVQSFGEMVPKFVELLGYELPWDEKMAPSVVVDFVAPKTIMPKEIIENNTGALTLAGVTIPATLNLDMCNFSAQQLESSCYAFMRKRRKIQNPAAATTTDQTKRKLTGKLTAAENEDSNPSVVN